MKLATNDCKKKKRRQRKKAYLPRQIAGPPGGQPVGTGHPRQTGRPRTSAGSPTHLAGEAPRARWPAGALSDHARPAALGDARARLAKEQRGASVAAAADVVLVLVVVKLRRLASSTRSSGGDNTLRRSSNDSSSCRQ